MKIFINLIRYKTKITQKMMNKNPYLTAGVPWSASINASSHASKRVSLHEDLLATILRGIAELSAVSDEALNERGHAWGQGAQPNEEARMLCVADWSH